MSRSRCISPLCLLYLFWCFWAAYAKCQWNTQIVSVVIIWTCPRLPTVPPVISSVHQMAPPCCHQHPVSVLSASAAETWKCYPSYSPLPAQQTFRPLPHVFCHCCPVYRRKHQGFTYVITPLNDKCCFLTLLCSCLTEATMSSFSTLCTCSSKFVDCKAMSYTHFGDFLTYCKWEQVLLWKGFAPVFTAGSGNTEHR